MKEVSFLPGEQIIKEGDDGDCHLPSTCLATFGVLVRHGKTACWCQGPAFKPAVQDFLCLIEEGKPECKKLIDGEEKVWILDLDLDCDLVWLACGLSSRRSVFHPFSDIGSFSLHISSP